MKIAVTYDNGQIFQHFGRTENFKVYEVEDGKVVSSEVIDSNGRKDPRQRRIIPRRVLDYRRTRNTKLPGYPRVIRSLSFELPDTLSEYAPVSSFLSSRETERMVDRHSGIYQETNGTGALAPHRTGTIPPAPSRMNAATVQNKCRHRTALFDHKHPDGGFHRLVAHDEILPPVEQRDDDVPDIRGQQPGVRMGPVPGVEHAPRARIHDRVAHDLTSPRARRRETSSNTDASRVSSPSFSSFMPVPPKNQS